MARTATTCDACDVDLALIGTWHRPGCPNDGEIHAPQPEPATITIALPRAEWARHAVTARDALANVRITGGFVRKFVDDLEALSNLLERASHG